MRQALKSLNFSDWFTTPGEFCFLLIVYLKQRSPDSFAVVREILYEYIAFPRPFVIFCFYSAK